MSDTPLDEAAPVVAPRVRTVTYFTALIEAPVAALAVALVAVLSPGHLELATAIAGAVTTFTATIAGALGVAYRPTAQAATGA